MGNKINTIETRKNIGFVTKKEDWIKKEAVYDKHSLKIAGHPVMEDWELNYMNTLARIATQNGGKILELGYGLGLSANAIQSVKIDNHYIIECNIGVIEKCIIDQKNAIESNKLHLLTGFWEDITPMIANESLDGILFDTYPLTEEEVHGNHFWFFKEAFRMLKPSGIFTYYSDEATDFSENHMEKLLEAGFKKENISFEICNLDTPPDCEYWQAKTMIAPIIRK